jgi:FMNH2-dependent dimethyl sulfone monooxygenase
MTNALFNDNRLKLGVFGLNVSNGCAATTAEGHLQPTWQNNLDIAVMADRAGIEALVPVARWKGFGGKTNFNGTCFETYTWAAGLAGGHAAGGCLFDVACADGPSYGSGQTGHYH